MRDLLRFPRVFLLRIIGLLALSSALRGDIQVMEPQVASNSEPSPRLAATPEGALAPIGASEHPTAPVPSATSPAPALADEWPQYRHDTQRSGRAGKALELGQDGALHLQWAYSFGE